MFMSLLIRIYLPPKYSANLYTCIECQATQKIKNCTQSLNMQYKYIFRAKELTHV